MFFTNPGKELKMVKKEPEAKEDAVVEPTAAVNPPKAPKPNPRSALRGRDLQAADEAEERRLTIQRRKTAAGVTRAAKAAENGS